MIKKIPFFLLGAAILAMTGFSLIGFTQGLFHIFAEAPAQDIEAGTIEFFVSLIFFFFSLFFLHSLASLYRRVFPKQEEK